MKSLCIALLVALLFFVFGCAAAPAVILEETAPPTANQSASIPRATIPPLSTDGNTEPTAEITVPVWVYEGASEDFLLPLNDFSSERQHDPEFVMIHFISAVVYHRDDPYNLEYIRQIFMDYEISTHYLILRDGTILCYIPEDRVAWHAGEGTYLDDPKYTDTMNQYAIGIELMGMGSEEDMSIYMTSQEYQELDDSMKGYTEEQYIALAGLIEDLSMRYDIPQDSTHIIGHETYSPEKTDPGELFDWSRILNETE